MTSPAEANETPNWSPGVGLVTLHDAVAPYPDAEPNRIDILTRVAGLEFPATWARRVTSTYGTVPVAFPSLEDLLVSKRACGRPQDLLDADEKQELLGSIEDYRLGLVPLIVPLTLLKHHVRRHKVEYLAGQVYLDPHPKELMLRNHV